VGGATTEAGDAVDVADGSTGDATGSEDTSDAGGVGISGTALLLLLVIVPVFALLVIVEVAGAEMVVRPFGFFTGFDSSCSCNKILNGATIGGPTY